MKLTVVHPRTLHKLPVLPSGTCWLYADDDPGIDERISQQFGNNTRLLSPLAFQAHAATLRAPFIAWVDRCLKGAPPEDWLPAAYFKDIFSCPVFLHAICLSLLQRHLPTQAVVLITSSSPLLRQLHQLATALGKSCTTFGWPYFALQKFWPSSLAWRHWALRPLRLAAGTVLAHHILGATQRERLKRIDVLVDSFLLPGDLQQDGTFKHRFLPGLLAYYQQKEKKAASLPRTEALAFGDLAPCFRAMRASATLFAPCELFLQLSDVFAGQWRTLRAAGRTKPFITHSFGEVDLNEIASYWWPIAVRQTVVSRILTATGSRMQEAGVAPRLFLDWYENQPIDKALNIAFCCVENAPKIVAMRQYLPAPNVISFFSTTEEVRHGVSPKINWACGKRTAQLFAAHDTLGNYRSIPALRYVHLHESAPNEGRGTNLVVFLTSAVGETLAILNLVLSNSDLILSHFASIQIKPHQALHIDHPSMATQRWPAIVGKAIHWETASSQTLMQQARLVVTAGSSVALEALCSAIPVIVVGRTAGLDVNPLEDIEPTVWRCAYTREEFATLIDEWLPSIPPLADRQTLGDSLREQYFTPATTSSMLTFLPD